MGSLFPNSIDSFTDPLANSPLNSPSHAGQHQDLNDAVEKVETYMGLVKVVPTSAVNGTVGATGTVTVGNTISSVTVNGAFSSLYDNYRIIYSGGVKSNDSEISMTLSSVATGYYLSFVYGSYTGTTVTNYGVNNGSSWTHAGGGYEQAAVVDVDLYCPFLPVATNGFARVRYATYWGTASLLNTKSVSSTGFTITSAFGTMTGGSIRVYGYRK